jgi:hypothetical protein
MADGRLRGHQASIEAIWLANPPVDRWPVITINTTLQMRSTPAGCVS